MKLLNFHIIILGIQMVTIVAVDVNIANLGIVRGTSRTVDGKTVDIFQGIPYAKPPVGDLRFSPPVIVAPWSGVRNATSPEIYCPQQFFFTQQILGNEDCLYLNIYRPAGACSGLHVMVWIHGGGYFFGSASEGIYNGEMLASKQNVLVVTINYRLGILGFFHVPGTRIQGNYGLLDQIMALNWVKSYISSFGGDKDKVTLFGQSAGGASVTLLMLSPLGTGLFSRVIAQSGSPTCFWAIQKQKDRPLSKDLASKLGCTGVGRRLITCLRSKTWNEILQEQLLLEQYNPLIRPTVDGYVIKAFPLDQLKEGKLPLTSVDLLIGFNKDEGTMSVPQLPAWNETLFEGLLKNKLKWQYNCKTDNVLKAASYNYPHYNQETANAKYSMGFSDFAADFLYIVCGVEFAGAWTKTATYLYEFTYLPQHRRFPQWLVSHGLELELVYGKPFYDASHPYSQGFFYANFTDTDKVVSENIMSMWANFARTGDPGNSWPVHNTETKQYMEINLNLTVKSDPRPKALTFWGKFIPEFLEVAKCPSYCFDWYRNGKY